MFLALALCQRSKKRANAHIFDLVEFLATCGWVLSDFKSVILHLTLLRVVNLLTEWKKKWRDDGQENLFSYMSFSEFFYIILKYLVKIWILNPKFHGYVGLTIELLRSSPLWLIHIFL